MRKAESSFLAEEAVDNIATRIGAINRRFAHGLLLSGRPECQSLFSLAEEWVKTSPADIDEEALPFAPESFDLIVSVLSLHAVNDLPGALLQIRQTLKPDGLFIAALFGGDSLRELRASFAAGEMAILGGVSPHVAPFADVRDLGGLLQRAGFALPVVDMDRLPVRYGSLDRLIADLRHLGETNILQQRRKTPLRRDVLAAMLQHYHAHFVDEEGRLEASFDIIYVLGWSPHDSQQKPLRPGSAKTRLADALGAQEQRLKNSCG